jgi:hypothetical protein
MKAIAIMAMATVCAGSALAQSIYSNQSANVNAFALNATASSNSGVGAPAGGRWSECENDTATTANTTAGFGFTGTFRLADNFVIPTGQTWNITAFHFASYRTGVAGVPHTSYAMQIWNGAPNAGGTVIFGDTTTNRFASATSTINYESGGSGNLFRIFNTVVPPATAPGTTRQIYDSTVTAVISLGAGTYWVDWIGGPAGGFYPATTHEGMRAPTGGGNALQWNGTAWVAAIDAGQGTAPPAVQQDLVFRIDGTVVPEPATMAALGLGLVPFLRRRRK